MTPPNEAATVERVKLRDEVLRPIRAAFADYDRTRPLVEGRVKPKGIDLTATTQWVGDFCNKPVYEEFDLAEMSLSMYVAARDKGEPCIAIPVFPLRDAIWAFMYTRADSPITDPSQLAGKRIGAEGYRYTINVWLRGLIKDLYRVSPEQITWVTGDVEGAGYVIPKGIPVEIRKGKSPAQKLKDGEVDAIFCPRVPKEFQDREPWIRRLFPDCQAAVRSLVKTLGYIPVSHVMVMNKPLTEREPQVAASMYHAFVEAQRVADEVCEIEKMTSYVETMFYIEEQKAAYGPKPFTHGFAPNRNAMETFIRYAHEQGYMSRRIPVEEMFVPQTLAL
jgi:4,5-dihydroxyphthalate decarboxylase